MRTHHRQRLSDMAGLTPLIATTDCADPQAAYRALRERWGVLAPVELEPGVNAWLVMGHHEICQLVRNERLFSRDPNNWRQYAEGAIPADSGLGPMMFPRDNAYYCDGERHRRLRGPIDDGLDSLNEHRMARLIRTTCAALVGAFAQRGAADLVADYAAVVPMLTMAGFLGFSQQQGQELGAAFAAAVSSDGDALAEARNMERIIGEVIEAHRGAPAEDLTTAFLRHPDLDDDFEVAQSMLLMIVGGYEGTSTWIAQVLRLMLTDPRFAGRLRGGRLGLDDALDEVLWRDPPMSNMPARYALVDCEFGNAHVERGDALIAAFAAANHDPRVRSADTWLELGNRSHLAWSAGPHACPAQRPGRMITRIAVETALHQLPDVSLAIPAGEIALLPSPWMRCPASLPVRFTV